MQALDFNLWSNIVTLAWTDLYLLLLCNSSTQVFGWCLSCPIVWTIFYLIKAIVGKSVNIFLAYCCAYRLDYAPLRRMYGLHTVFLECGQLVRPPNWLSSLYGLTVKKTSIIFDVLKQKYWRSLQDNSKRSFMQYGFMILTTPHWSRITTISGSAFFISRFIIWQKWLVIRKFPTSSKQKKMFTTTW